jgi:hypothetical protein
MLTFDEIVVNLKVLKQLEKHQKLNTQGIYLNIESKSIIPEAIRRWKRGDDRNTALHQINSTVSAAISLISQYPVFVLYLKECRAGLENMKDTYAQCGQTCARLDAILDCINMSLKSNSPQLVHTHD